ncbi:MAG: hypothetical protein GX577_00975 [Leptolinea sp.]|nr:hypothetical protein [Leptolinea sp.]
MSTTARGSFFPVIRGSEIRACYNQHVVNKKTASSLEGEPCKGSSEDTRQMVRVEAAVELPPGAEVQITVCYKPDEGSAAQKRVVDLAGERDVTTKHLSFEFLPGKRQKDLKNSLRLFWKWFKTNALTPAGLFFWAVAVYYLVRLIRLSDFPIFFFTDEAIHTMLAADLVRNEFIGPGDELLPTFFKSGTTYNAGFPVYLQVLPVLLGIKSVFATRFVSTTVTLLAALGLGSIYSRVHSRDRAWLAVMVLSLIPAWFYHTRTAFETVEAVSFYTIFLLGYIRYREGDFRWLYVALAAIVMAFYSYSPARVVMALTGMFLLISDARYHWDNRKQLWKPFLLGLLLAVPYFRFLYLHPGENQHHLEVLGSYWIKSEPLSWKLLQFGYQYVRGLNPFYWFFPNATDLSRHIMKGMGHLGWYFVPFFLAGLVLAIGRFKDPKYRVMLIALFLAPTGAAVAEIGITRAMFMVIPAGFFITIGVEYAYEWLLKTARQRKTYDLLFFFLLIGCNFLFLDRVLTNGPTWHNYYGMSGMQYGARQVFGKILEIRKADPTVPIMMTPDWANGTDVLARFFLGDPVSIEMSSMDAFIDLHKPFEPETIFIMPQDDYIRVINSGKFEPMKVMDMIPYPDGTAGFIFANLKYHKLAGKEFEEELVSRHILRVDSVDVNGETLDAAISELDMGELQSLFDHDPGTVVRSVEANPLVVEVVLPKPTAYRLARVMVGGSATQVTVYALPEGSDNPHVSSLTVSESTEIRNVMVPLATDEPVTRLRFEVRTVRDGEPAHVHAWGIELE